MDDDALDPAGRASELLWEHPDRFRWLLPRRDVFISYAHARTSAYASNLRAALVNAGLTCYLDDLDFREGQSLTGTAVRQIGRSRLVLRLEVAGDPSTYWMDLEREVARQRGVDVATLSLGGRPSDPDEIAYVDAAGDEPSADVVVAIVRRFTLPRRRRARAFTALALLSAVAAAGWGLTTPIVAARSLDEVDEARLDRDWRNAAEALLGIPGRRRSRTWLRYANEVLLGHGLRQFDPAEAQRTVPAGSVLAILPDERRLWLRRAAEPPPPPMSGLAVRARFRTYLGRSPAQLRLEQRVLAEHCWDAGTFGDSGTWAITGAVDIRGGELTDPPVLAVIEAGSGTGAWRQALTENEPWRVLGSSDGAWIVLLQGAAESRDMTALRHHLRSGQTESARWAHAPAAWFLGRCATLDGPTIVTCDGGELAEIDFETGRASRVEPLSRNRAAEAMAISASGRRVLVGNGQVDVWEHGAWWGARLPTSARAEEVRFAGDDEVAIRFGDGLTSTVVRIGTTPTRASYLLGKEIIAQR